MGLSEPETFDAGILAKAWLSVALAASTDPEMPALNRTVLIERFASGLRLVATDRYVLLTSFVPNLTREFTDEPDPYVVPDDIAVAMDLDGRGRGLLGYLRRLAAKAERDGLPRVEVSVGLNVVDESDAPTLSGMESRYVRIEYEASERVQLDIYGGEYPNWRNMVTGFEPESVDTVSLNPEVLGRLARAGKILDNAPISWRFAGEHKAADVTLSAIDPRVTGVVIPMNVSES